jgi:hypothetical protein
MEDSPAFGAIVVEDDHPVLLDRLAVGFALGFALGGRAISADLTGLDDAIGELDVPFPGRQAAFRRGRVPCLLDAEHSRLPIHPKALPPGSGDNRVKA